MVFNANYISVMLWQSVLLVEETRGPRENHRPVASHRHLGLTVISCSFTSITVVTRYTTLTKISLCIVVTNTTSWNRKYSKSQLLIKKSKNMSIEHGCPCYQLLLQGVHQNWCPAAEFFSLKKSGISLKKNLGRKQFHSFRYVGH
jgi:hypothetical protein